MATSVVAHARIKGAADRGETDPGGLGGGQRRPADDRPARALAGALPRSADSRGRGSRC
jgi:hypothetical protein